MKILDIGNSRIKCYKVNSIDDVKIVFEIPAKKQTLESYLSMENKSQLYVLSTNRDFSDFILINKLNKIDNIFFEKLTDFKPPYEGYGIDRLINSYAACKLYSKDVLVVNMGSAITYDIIKDGKILYGYITPGLSQRKEILNAKIPHLPIPKDEMVDQSHLKPTNTKEAIAFGILKEITSTIVSIKNQEQVEVVISGGDAHFVEHISEKLIVDKLLAPKGVFLAFKDKQS